MKIYSINSINFTGQRQDRKTIAQLKQDNKYDLNLINQRRINKAIDTLAEISEEDNINFLIDVSENLKYGTNIDLGKQSYNDWRVKLNDAVRKSYEKAPKDVQERLADKVAHLSDKKALTPDEQEILTLRDSILKRVDFDQLAQIPSDNIKNLLTNLDYFIISSEVPTSQKLYIMKRLNHFMSYEYKINPQLGNKKTQALAEIVNDIVVDTPESKIPNIKAVNQRSHGMCAAIAICRKDLAYEDKANFVDMVLSELDESPYMMIYDITKLGTNTKIPVSKPELDFDYALSRGYRIIDTSALYWMHIADTEFVNNEAVGMYTPFDKTYFDTFNDSHLMPDIDENLSVNQDYYRALLKSKDAIGSVKKEAIIREYKQGSGKVNVSDELETMYEYSKNLSRILYAIAPNSDKEKIQNLVSDLIKLEVRNSDAAQRVSDYKKSFVYLPNETRDVKEEKIRAFLSISLEDKNTKILNKKVPEILDILTSISQIKSQIHSSSRNKAKEVFRAKSLYEAAAAYRTQMLLRLEVPEELNDMLISCNIPDRETRIRDNMAMLIKKLEVASMSEDELKGVSRTKIKKSKISEELLEGLAKSFQTEPDPEMIKIALEENKASFDYIMTDLLDDYYRAILMVSRKNVLKKEIENLKQSVEMNNPVVLLNLARDLRMDNNQKKILARLDSYLETLDSENCTNDDYIRIYNEMGKKNQIHDFATYCSALGNALFEDKDKNIIAGFNKMHGLPQNAPIEETEKVFVDLCNRFNKISYMTKALQNALEIHAWDGTILNTVMDKELIIKEWENVGEIISEQDLRAFQNKFNNIEAQLLSYDGVSKRVKDLSKDVKTFTPHEKEVLKLIEDRINSWYKQTTRALDAQYRTLEKPLSELHRKVGVKTGARFLRAEGDSGLVDAQQVKIVEHMTDRPYYVENNARLAINKLKVSPYSGISSTSVDDKAPAYHAQYISDVKPVKIENGKGEIVEKEVLFHDNTWGPSEHENTWIDRNGMLRTDYLRQYGGELGYITNEKYQSGKFVDNMIGKYGVLAPSHIESKRYKKLVGGSDFEYRYPMFNNVIISGKSPDANKQVLEIRNNTLISPSIYFEDLVEAARKMEYSEVQSTINKVESISAGLYDKYDNLERRVLGLPPFEKGIRTRKDYDNLSDNDPLKIILEQISLLLSYNDVVDTKLFSNEFSMEDLRKLRGRVHKLARKNFDYTFGKTPDITLYGTAYSRKMLTPKLQEFAKENNIKIIPSQINKIINSLKNIDRKKFDGSLEKTTELMSESFAKSLYNKTPDFENKKEKIEALRQEVQKYLYDNMIFKPSDLKNPKFGSGRLAGVCSWIDRTFDPKTDEEFIEIFRKLQQMTLVDYEKQYGSTITNEDMGLKELTGYDILTRLRSYDENAQRNLLNVLYGREIGKQLKLSVMSPSYDYDKYEKVLRGFTYKEGERTFDDIYYDYYWSLYLLKVQDMYAKMRKNLFDQYKVFPAYPVMEYEEEESIGKVFQAFIEHINDSIEDIDSFKKQDIAWGVIEGMQKYISRFSDSTVLNEKQRERVDEDLRDFINLVGPDESIKDSVSAVCNLMELPVDAPASEYKKNIQIVYDEISMYSTTPDGKTLADTVQLELDNLNNYKREFITSNFSPKYHRKAYTALNHYIQARMINSREAGRILQEEFVELYEKHRITKHPELLLNDYLLMICKPKSGGENMATEENIEKLKAEIAKLENDGTKKSAAKAEKLKEKLEPLEDKYNLAEAYSSLLRKLLVCANVLELEYIFMECAKKANLNIVREEFKNSTITLKSGKVVKMDSEEALSALIMPLILGNATETTMMFVEKLGLQEGAARMIMKSLRLDDARKAIIRIDNIYGAISDQNKYIQEELEKLGDIDDDPDYAKKIEEAKKNVLRRCKNTNYKKSLVMIETAFNQAIKDIEEDTKHSKTALLHLCLERVKECSLAIGTEEVEKINSQIYNFELAAGFAKKIKLPEGSEVEKEMQEFLQKIEDLENLAAKRTREYPYLGITTVTADTPY